jgi:hypothetical protein
MRSLPLVLVLAGTVAAARPALADATRVTGVVETANAVFFQPSQFPNVVWFFPRTELSFTMVPPQQPTGTFWRAAIVFKHVTQDDLAQLPADWATRSFVPFIIRPTTECTLTRLPEMRFVTQEIRALGHDVSSANPTVCRFSLRLPTVMSPDLQDRLNALVNSDTLVHRVLDLELDVEVSIAWTDVLAAVTAALGETAPAVLTREEARAAIADALASPALAEVRAAVTATEADAFIDAAVANLFTSGTGSPGLTLVTTAPAGSLVYHLQPFQRFM